MHRQLCQVGVLSEALKLIEQLHPNAKVAGLNPTQQSGHAAMGTDGGNTIWSLETFGGVNVTNNGKAAKDARKLLTSRGVLHRYFACFADAWGDYRPQRYTFSEVAKSQTQPHVLLMSVENAASLAV